MKFRVHHNKVTGAISSAQESTFHSFRTYVLFLKGITKIFGGKRQGWNKNYAAAKKIFGRGPQAAVIRGAIHLQHAELYRHGFLKTEEGVLTTGNAGSQFLRLIDFGLRDGRRRFYTYVILPDRMRFCESGAQMFKDFMSKHAMHADAARDVVYSGEFTVVDKGQGNGYLLVIDNNSGTYAPSKDDLPLLQQLMQFNFPDIEIKAVDFNDPQLKLYHQDVAR